ncbi:entericidin B membrane lipoprotein [Yersinia intermedia ATCC 29909]|nr:entericidin B membrane lipoprotein [Yersinia intermedia ATCC 29909]
MPTPFVVLQALNEEITNNEKIMAILFFNILKVPYGTLGLLSL